MKKIINGFLIIFIMMFAFGCNPQDNEDDTLRVGMDLRWPPFETITTDREPTGISVDLAYALGDYLDKTVEIIDLEFGSLITELEAGTIDIIIGSMSITEDRALKINFSDPYFYFPLITVLNKSFQDEHQVTTKEELFQISGVRYVGPKTFVSLSIPREEALNPIINEVNDANAAILEVTTGVSDAFIISASSAAEYYLANPDTTTILWDPIMLSPIGMGLRKTDTLLLEQVNQFIAGLETNGVYNMLRQKYDAIIGETLPSQTLDFYILNDEE